MPLKCNLVINTINKLELDEIEKDRYIKSYHIERLNDVFLFGDQQLEFDHDRTLKFINDLFTLIVSPYNTNGRYTNTRLPRYLIEVYSTKNKIKMVSFDSDHDKGKVIESIVDFVYDVYNNILDQ
jgi:hypothetical protein